MQYDRIVSLLASARTSTNPRAFVTGQIRTALSHLKTSNAKWARVMLGFSRDDLPKAPAGGMVLTWKKPLHEIDVMVLDQLLDALRVENLEWVTQDRLKAIRAAASAAAVADDKPLVRQANDRTSRRLRVKSDLAALGATEPPSRQLYLQDAIHYYNLFLAQCGNSP